MIAWLDYARNKGLCKENIAVVVLFVPEGQNDLGPALQCWDPTYVFFSLVVESRRDD